MRLGIDISPIAAHRTGVGEYCYRQLEHVLELAPEIDCRGLSTGLRRIELGPLQARVRHRHIPLPTRALYAVWNTFGGPAADRLTGPVDVYHATNYFLPPVRAAKRVTTFYDLTFLAHPEWCSPRVVGPFSRQVTRATEESDAILTCSEATKRDIVRLLGAPEDKITVAYGAAGASFRPVERQEARERIEARYGIAGPYALFVGTLEPRKNVERMVNAFAEVAGDVQQTLVLAGATGWGLEGIERALERPELAGRVIRPGYVASADLPSLYSAADLFIFPSLYEGFGLPVLEAMQCGCPVLTSTNSSLPEVAGDAAEMVDAEDTEAIAEAMRSLLRDESRRADMASRGLEHARNFTWRSCAETTLGVYRSLAPC